MFEKLKTLGVELGKNNWQTGNALNEIESHLTADELQILETLRSRRLVREDLFEMDSFTLDTVDGMAPNMVRGKLGLVKSEQARIDTSHFSSPLFLDGKAPGHSGWKCSSPHVKNSTCELNDDQMKRFVFSNCTQAV